MNQFDRFQEALKLNSDDNNKFIVNPDVESEESLIEAAIGTD